MMRKFKQLSMPSLCLLAGLALVITQSAFSLSKVRAEYKYINTGVHYIKVDDADISGCSWVSSPYYCAVETNTDMGGSFTFSQYESSGATPIPGASLSVYEQ